MPGESLGETAQPRDLLTGIANQTQGQFREPFPPMEPTTTTSTTTGLWESLPGELWDSLPTHEQGIVFVVDLSESMNKELCAEADGGWELHDSETEHHKGERCTTYMGLMKRELVSSIGLLRPDQKFAIIGYSTAYEELPRYSDQLIPASDANKEGVETWLKQGWLHGSGERDIAFALEHAVDMPDVDAVYLLSSGMPSRNLCTKVCCMMFEKVPIHTSLFMPGQGNTAEQKEAKTLLKDVATQSRGIFTEPYALESGNNILPILLIGLILLR